MERKDHWEKVYTNNKIESLGWYEVKPEQSLKLIKNCKISKDEIIFDAGSGVSTLIDNLLELGYQNIIATDISSAALGKLKSRVGEKNVKCVVADLSQNISKIENESISLWHDRAVFHFLTNENDRKQYLENLKNLLKPNGQVIIATFNLEGAKKCSGLDTINYDENSLSEFLGKDFKLVEFFNHIYTNPNGGIRPYVYTRFVRSK